MIIIYIFCRADVTLTDLEDFIPLLNLNIDTNKHIFQGAARAQALKWGEPIKDSSLFNPDYILIADCVYYEEVN